MTRPGSRATNRGGRCHPERSKDRILCASDSACSMSSHCTSLHLASPSRPPSCSMSSLIAPTVTRRGHARRRASMPMGPMAGEEALLAQGTRLLAAPSARRPVQTGSYGVGGGNTRRDHDTVAAKYGRNNMQCTICRCTSGHAPHRHTLSDKVRSSRPCMMDSYPLL